MSFQATPPFVADSGSASVDHPGHRRSSCWVWVTCQTGLPGSPRNPNAGSDGTAVFDSGSSCSTVSSGSRQTGWEPSLVSFTLVTSASPSINEAMSMWPSLRIVAPDVVREALGT